VMPRLHRQAEEETGDQRGESECAEERPGRHEQGGDEGSGERFHSVSEAASWGTSTG
jgi:hypothetical protein